MSKILDRLVANGILKSYQEIPYPDATMCESDKLVLEFPNGEKIGITGFSSGCMENVSLWIEDEQSNTEDLIQSLIK